MLRTLQLYVGKELLKTFALTAVGLTLTFSLCGGVLNMIQAELLTASTVIRILGFIMPVALTLTLPVSALFASAIVYGRFASDNEIEACKASGINIHRLLAPAMALSVATAAFTFLFANFVLPNFIERLEAMVRKDMEKILIHSLNTKGYISHDPYALYARDAKLISQDNGEKIVHIQNAAFLELEGENLKSCGTADEVRVDFLSKSEGGNPVVQAAMYGVKGLDLKRDEFYQVREQPINSVEIPNKVPQKPKYLTLPQLVMFLGDLTQVPAIRDRVENMRNGIREASFYRYAVNQLNGPEHMLRLSDDQRRYEVHAERVSQDSTDFRIELTQMQVTQTLGKYTRHYKAERGTVRFRRGFGHLPDRAMVILRGNVSFTDSRDPQHPVAGGKQSELDEVAVPAAVLTEANALSNRDILGLPAEQNKPLDFHALQKEEPQSLELGERIQAARVSTRKDLVKAGLEISGIIHSRLAFSASVLVMLILAAALGIIYRGGQMLTAFVISFVPGLLVVVMNIMGRQLAENIGTHTIGIAVIWGAIVLVAAADVVVLTRFLRR